MTNNKLRQFYVFCINKSEEAEIHWRKSRFVVVTSCTENKIAFVGTRRALSTQTLLRALRSATLPTFPMKTGRKCAFIG